MKNQLQRALILIVALAAIATATALPAAAQSTTDVRTAELAPPAGSPAAAFGLVHAAQSQAAEHFRVRVFGDLPDGTLLMVSVRRSDRPSTDAWVDVGTLRMVLGSGILSLRDDVGYSTPAFPLDGVEAVTVSDDGVVILAASF